MVRGGAMDDVNQVHAHQALKDAADAYFPNGLDAFLRIAERANFREAGKGMKRPEDFAELRRRTALAEAIAGVLRG